MGLHITLESRPSGFQSFISNGAVALLGDEPISAQGTGAGFSPVELVLSGLAHCKASTIRFYARKQEWPLESVRVEVWHDVKKGERGLTNEVRVDIQMKGQLSPEQEAQLLEKADRCYVHRLLQSEWNITR